MSAGLQTLSLRIEERRLVLRNNLERLIQPCQELWELQYDNFSRGGPNWRVYASVCIGSMSVCREILLVLDTIKDVPEQFSRALSRACELASEIAGKVFKPNMGEDVCNYSRPEETLFLSKCWEHLLQLGLYSMDRHTLAFAPQLPQWLNLCVNASILAVDSDLIHSIRAKSRVLVVRFVARALLQPFFRKDGPSWLTAMLSYKSGNSTAEMNPALSSASSYLNDMLSLEKGKCQALVEAIISKYIVLSPEEREEWTNDPEDFAREIDVECSPDADTPRPCGIALLDCMLEHAEEPVQTAILELARSVIENPNNAVDDQSIMTREAIYRTVGECFPHLKEKVMFDSWYASELRAIVSSPALPNLSPFSASIIKSRAIWLIGVCAENLSLEHWHEAILFAVQNIGNQDVVVALMAVAAVTSVLSSVLEEQEFLSRPDEETLLLLEGPGSSPRADPGFMREARTEHSRHLETVLSVVDLLLSNCFGLLARLNHIESMIHVFECLSNTVELVGDKIASHFQSFSNSIIPVWSMMSNRSDGSMIRLQCTLLSLLGQLVSKLGRVAVEDQQIFTVIYSLLATSTDRNNQGVDSLGEDALRLWLELLRAAPSLTIELQQLGPARLVPYLEKEKDLDLSLQIATAYALHGGISSVQGMLQLLAAICTKVIQAAIESLTDPKEKEKERANLASLGLISSQTVKELNAALALLHVLQRLFASSTPPELEAPIKASCRLLTVNLSNSGRSTMMPSTFLPSRMVQLLQPALQIVYRVLFNMPATLDVLTDGDMEAKRRLIDRWVIIGSSHDVGEVFVPSMASLGRSRRHNAAVALCSLIVSDATDIIRDRSRVARMLILALKAAREQPIFEQDQQALWQKPGTEHPNSSESQDYLREKKLNMIREDVLRGMDARDAARNAANHVCGWMGRTALLEQLEAFDPVFKAEMEKLLSAQLPENEANEAIQSMQNAHI